MCNHVMFFFKLNIKKCFIEIKIYRAKPRLLEVISSASVKNLFIQGQIVSKV